MHRIFPSFNWLTCITADPDKAVSSTVCPRLDVSWHHMIWSADTPTEKLQQTGEFLFLYAVHGICHSSGSISAPVKANWEEAHKNVTNQTGSPLATPFKRGYFNNLATVCHSWVQDTDIDWCHVPGHNLRNINTNKVKWMLIFLSGKGDYCWCKSFQLVCARLFLATFNVEMKIYWSLVA